MYQSDGAKTQYQYEIWSLCTVLDFQADEHDSLKRRWEELSASSRQQQEQINHLTQVNGELTQGNQRLTQQADRIPGLTAQIEALTQVNGELTQSNERLTQQANRLPAMMAQINELTQGNGELTQANQDLTDANRELTQANRELTARLNELTRNNQRLSEANQRLDEANRQLTIANQGLAAENGTLTAQMNELTQANQQLTDGNQRLSDANQRHQQMHRDLAEANQRLTQQQERDRITIHELHEQNANLQGQVQGLAQGGGGLHQILMQQVQNQQQQFMEIRHAMALLGHPAGGVGAAAGVVAAAAAGGDAQQPPAAAAAAVANVNNQQQPPTEQQPSMQQASPTQQQPSMQPASPTRQSPPSITLKASSENVSPDLSHKPTKQPLKKPVVGQKRKRINNDDDDDDHDDDHKSNDSHDSGHTVATAILKDQEGPTPPNTEAGPYRILLENPQIVFESRDEDRKEWSGNVVQYNTSRMLYHVDWYDLSKPYKDQKPIRSLAYWNQPNSRGEPPLEELITKVDYDLYIADEATVVTEMYTQTGLTQDSDDGMRLTAENNGVLAKMLEDMMEMLACGRNNTPQAREKAIAQIRNAALRVYQRGTLTKNVGEQSRQKYTCQSNSHLAKAQRCRTFRIAAIQKHRSQPHLQGDALAQIVQDCNDIDCPRCKIHPGHKNLPAMNILTAITDELYNQHRLRQRYSTAHARKEKLTKIADNYNKPSVSFGQFLLLIKTLDPDLPSVRVLRNDDTGETVTLVSLSDRLQDWINHPECWICLHLCSWGFDTLRCACWKHVWPGTNKLNINQIRFHRYLEIMTEGEPADTLNGLRFLEKMVEGYNLLPLFLVLHRG